MLKEEDIGPTGAWVLKKIYRYKHGLINFDDLKQRGMSNKDLEKELKKLENLGWILKKKGNKSSLYRYILVAKYMPEIEKTIKKYYPEFITYGELR